MTEQEYKDAVAMVIEHLYTKDEVIVLLTELKDLIDKLPNKRHYITENGVTYGYKDYEPSAKDASQLVQAKINQLRSEE